MSERRLLVVTNDFPPRPGGIQSFVHGVVSRLPADRVVVVTSSWRGAAAWDRTQPYPVVRQDTSVLLPSPAARRAALAAFHEHGCTDVWFGAAAPLGLLAPALRAAGAERIVATTHGHEARWASLPAARRLLRRIAGEVDTVTYLGEYTRRRLEPALGPFADRLTRLVPGVDAARFARDDTVRASIRAELGLSDRPVVLCVSRLMPRKGQDTLVSALPEIRRRVPGAALLLVGGGPSRSRLERSAARLGLGADVVVRGSVAHDDLPGWYAAGDVFAMPCRDRLGGLDIEGLGIVYLEAAAAGLPVVAGDGGGASDAVLDGVSGRVVPGRVTPLVADAVAGLLADPSRAAAMGERGRAWVAQQWTWDRSVGQLRALLGW